MDGEDLPPRPSPIEAAALKRRQRAKNIAMLVGLCLLALLFYAISIAKMKV